MGEKIGDLGFILVIVTYKSLCPYEIFISVE
jgi:hypothetical protein